MTRTDRASLLIHADTDRVFAALIDPEALTKWLPPSGMRGRFESFDLREGGSYRLVLTYDDPSASPGKTTPESDVSEVRIVRIVPGELLVQQVNFASEDAAFTETMLMQWRVSGGDDGTTVEFEARNVPDGIRASDHADGLTSSLSNLARYLEGDR